MANELNAPLGFHNTGLTVSARLVKAGAVEKTISLTERGSTGSYSNAGAIGAVAGGVYSVEFVDADNNLLRTGEIELNADGTEVTVASRLAPTTPGRTLGVDADGKAPATLGTDAITALSVKDDAVTKIQAGLSTLTQANVRTAVGLATNNLDAQLAVIQNLGAGPVVYTVNVKSDSAVNLQNATVSMTEGANVYRGTTNASGNVTFGLTAATYTLAIVKSGYQYTPTSQVISVSTTLNVTMTATTIPAAADPEQCTVYTYAYQGDGITPNEGAYVYFRLKTPAGDGRADLRSPRQVIADADGLISIDLPRSFVYEFRYTDKGEWEEFTVDDEASMELPSIVSAVSA